MIIFLDLWKLMKKLKISRKSLIYNGNRGFVMSFKDWQLDGASDHRPLAVNIKNNYLTIWKYTLENDLMLQIQLIL